MTRAGVLVSNIEDISEVHYTLGVIETVALKANITKNVSASQVAAKAPREFGPFIDVRRLTDGPYTVIAFPGMRGESSSIVDRSEEHTSELQSLAYLVCRLLLEKKKKKSIVCIS